MLIQARTLSNATSIKLYISVGDPELLPFLLAFMIIKGL